MPKEISDRLQDQRLRNRIMESILWLSEGVGSWGADEYFNQFYDQMSFDDQPFPNTAMTANESEALQSLCGLMNRASAATPKNVSFGLLAESGWLALIQNEAKRVLKVFLKRGRCYEDQEGEPSVELGLSWYNQSEKLA